MPGSGSEEAWQRVVERCRGSLDESQLVRLEKGELRQVLAHFGVGALDAARAEVRWQVLRQLSPGIRASPSEELAAVLAAPRADQQSQPATPVDTAADAPRHKLLSPPRPSISAPAAPVPAPVAPPPTAAASVPAPASGPQSSAPPSSSAHSPPPPVDAKRARAGRRLVSPSPSQFQPRAPTPTRVSARSSPYRGRALHPKEWEDVQSPSSGPHLSRRRALSPAVHPV
eukprot:TRINITY_DN19133_c0_g1_i2.p3 TRINITY_DN19133_c0_g1~~TRINITY_DN19133_c0_g1_i2.p3  ORF type:complete len:251 (+),score=67.43 TRINITY_DN19133_c0_g1_i2:70-753(+)